MGCSVYIAPVQPGAGLAPVARPQVPCRYLLTLLHIPGQPQLGRLRLDPAGPAHMQVIVPVLVS
jgi:hypothetical protein